MTPSSASEGAARRSYGGFRVEEGELKDLQAYAREHPHILSFLPEAYEEMNKRWGDDAHLILRVERDPGCGGRELWALALTSLSAREAHDRQDRVDEEWWLEASRETHHELHVGIEFTGASTRGSK